VNGVFLVPEIERRLIRLRHDLHKHPELSLEENRTAQLLHDELADLPLKALDRVAGTGVVARIAGLDPTRPAVALRGDIDALPIHEATGVHFASVNAGVMHACGHDVHAAWTVGAAHVLASERPAGDIVVLLQPGEETGHGAQLLIEAGALDGVGAIFGAHVDMRYLVGEVVAQSGNVAASADEFAIELQGRGCHAARPHEGKDPIVAAAALVTALQTITSRQVSPGTPAVVTVGMLHGGTATNVIPDVVQLAGTLRATDSRTRGLLHSELHRMAADVARAYGVQAQVDITMGTPPLVNDTRCVGWARQAVAEVLGESAISSMIEPNLGGEDFAHYLGIVPGCFMRIGSRREGSRPIPAHTAEFLPADEAIGIGAAVLARAARLASEALGTS